jgi:hypothetical protein
MRDLREDARAQSNLNAVLGVERQITALRAAKLELMEAVGLLPRNLGLIRHIHETRAVVDVVMSVLNQVEQGGLAAPEAKRELLALLERRRADLNEDVPQGGQHSDVQAIPLAHARRETVGRTVRDGGGAGTRGPRGR